MNGIRRFFSCFFVAVVLQGANAADELRTIGPNHQEENPPSTSEELWGDIRKLIDVGSEKIDPKFVASSFGVAFGEPLRRTDQAAYASLRLYALSSSRVWPFRLTVLYDHPGDARGLMTLDWGESLGRGFPTVVRAPKEMCIRLRERQAEIKQFGWHVLSRLPEIPPMAPMIEYKRGEEMLRIYLEVPDRQEGGDCIRQLQLFI